jgi:hypothetical protein
MRYHRPYMLFIICSSFFWHGCMKHDPDTKNCSLSTGTYTTPVATTVIYRLAREGAVIVDSVVYHGANGLVKVKTPSLSFDVTVDLPAGATIGITAAGTAINGQFSIEYAYASHTDTTRARDICFNKNP